MQKGFSQNDTLIYIGDPMCSWCYGFSPELDKIKEAFPNVAFEMVMGGLRPEGRETIGDLKEFLTHHWIDVQKASGQKFNFHILDHSNIYYDTEPSCRAVIIFNKMKPDSTYAFFKSVQKSFYLENNHPLELETYAALASKFDIDVKEFSTRFNDRQSKMDAFSDFSLAEAMGINSFPALVVKIDGKLYLACKGYQKASTVIRGLKAKGMH